MFVVSQKAAGYGNHTFMKYSYMIACTLMIDISELIPTARCAYDIECILRKVIIEVSGRI